MDESTDTSYNNEIAPSMGSIIGDRGHSNPSGTNSSYNRPPSYDVEVHRDYSHTRESSAGGSNAMEIDGYSLGPTSEVSDICKIHHTSLKTKSNKDPEELGILKTLKIAFYHANKKEAVIHKISLHKQSNVGDVINKLKPKVTLSHPNAELRLLLLEVEFHKIYKIFPRTKKIEDINDQYRFTLCAEEIPEEEKTLGPQDILIQVYHFTKGASQNEMVGQNFGEPFFMIIRENETLAYIKVRIQRKLEVRDEEFSKWKFAFDSLGHLEYLQDSDVLSTWFRRRDVYDYWEQSLGLEHSFTIPERSFTTSKDIWEEIFSDYKSSNRYEFFFKQLMPGHTGSSYTMPPDVCETNR